MNRLDQHARPQRCTLIHKEIVKKEENKVGEVGNHYYVDSTGLRTSFLFTEVESERDAHHPLQYQILLTIGHMTKYDIATQGKSTTKKRIPSSVDDPRHAYYPTGN
jgi:hypothetical protein